MRLTGWPLTGSAVFLVYGIPRSGTLPSIMLVPSVGSSSIALFLLPSHRSPFRLFPRLRPLVMCLGSASVCLLGCLRHPRRQTKGGKKQGRRHRASYLASCRLLLCILFILTEVLFVAVCCHASLTARLLASVLDRFYTAS